MQEMMRCYKNKDKHSLKNSYWLPATCNLQPATGAKRP
jgi:hypothetical protein